MLPNESTWWSVSATLAGRGGRLVLRAGRAGRGMEGEANPPEFCGGGQVLTEEGQGPQQRQPTLLSPDCTPRTGQQALPEFVRPAQRRHRYYEVRTEGPQPSPGAPSGGLLTDGDLQSDRVLVDSAGRAPPEGSAFVGTAQREGRRRSSRPAVHSQRDQQGSASSARPLPPRPVSAPRSRLTAPRHTLPCPAPMSLGACAAAKIGDAGTLCTHPINIVIFYFFFLLCEWKKSLMNAGRGAEEGGGCRAWKWFDLKAQV